ncbi:MAG: apolipoprotein N-acyltransferase [Synechococcales bacterium]|nr:apolipoprotein N-acyltransferase [Synechococcales bacterium]
MIEQIQRRAKTDPSLPGKISGGKLAIALFSGIAMGLTAAPVGAWFLAWVALAPLWQLILADAFVKETSLKHGPRPWWQQLPWRPITYCLVWGLGYCGLAMVWIRDLHPLTWMGIPWLTSVAIAFFCWSFLAGLGAMRIAIWGGLFALAIRALRPSSLPPASPMIPWLPLVRVLIGAALWCGGEALWSGSILYWLSLAFTQSPQNLWILHLGQLSGPMAVTAAIAAVNGLLAEAWLHRPGAAPQPRDRGMGRRCLAIALLLLVGSHLVGAIRYYRPLTSSADATLHIGIIQGNVPTRIKLYEEGLRLAFTNYTTAYHALVDQQVDAVLTPEGAMPIVWGEPNVSRNPLYQAIRDRGVPAWVGTFYPQNGHITQSLLTITGDGEVLSHYDKVKLVPLGEYIPYQALLGGLIRRLSPVDATMVPGDRQQQVLTPFGQAIVGICYDSAFPWLFRTQAAGGGEFILTASNNDPYNRAMMAQHHAQDVMRAIETDRWAVRATNTGYSGVVNPRGQTVWRSPARTAVHYAATIARRQTQTPYVRWGDWLTPLLLVAAILAGIGSRLTRG